MGHKQKGEKKMDNNIMAIRSKIWGEVDKEVEIFHSRLNTDKRDLKAEMIKTQMIKTQMGLIIIALDTAEIAGAAPVEREIREIEKTMELIEARYQIGNYSRIIDIIRAIDKEALGQTPAKERLPFEPAPEDL